MPELPALSPLADEVFALFDDGLSDAADASLLLTDYRQTLVCDGPEQVAGFFQSLGQQSDAWLVLAADYAAGCWFEPRLRRLSNQPPGTEPPALRAYVFGQARRLSRGAVSQFLAERLAVLPEQAACAGLTALTPEVTEAEFRAGVDRIRRYIAAGDCYQVNFTFGLNGSIYGEPLALYARLRAAQPVRYGGYFQLPGRTVLSLSPELFLARTGERVTVHPMKGTAARGATPEADQAAARALQASEKNRAENLMIVDLIRNDLGRLAAPGAVKVDSLFRLESYPTVHQLVSTVSADLPGRSLAALFGALFPCGSITGAPKIRAMEIIAELEKSPRGLYTGALGWVAPNGDCRFNVPIRTLELDAAGQAHLGVGAGIVQDSEPGAEWRECLAKAVFATGLEPGFDLIESLRLELGTETLFPLLELHLDRLEQSCATFGFRFDRMALHWQLMSHGDDYGRRKKGVAKTRLLVRKNGTWEIESSPLPPPPDGPVGLVWAESRVDAGDPLQSHKTTRRAAYDRELARIARLPGVFDAVFLNEKGEVAEGARSNIVVRLADGLWTPPISAGALPGVQRRRLLEQGMVGERRLMPADLVQADAIFLCNAVRGLIPAHLVSGQPG